MRDQCDNCKSLDSFIFDNVEGNELCINCGAIQTAGVTSGDIEYRNIQFESGRFCNKVHHYNRESHIIHILRELIGECETKIPPEVLKKVDKKPLDFDNVKRRLRKYKLSNYIICAPRILNMLQNRTFAYLNGTEFLLIVKTFRQIFQVWDKIKKRVAPKRKSFLSYYYVLRKVCEFHKLNHLLPDLPRVKSKGVLQFHDKIWNYLEVYLE